MELQEHERIDDLHINNYRIIQNPKAFCFGMDAVLLSDFINVKEGARVLDLGTGTGIIPILLEAKTKGGFFTGLEIQKESAKMAARSVLMNNQQEKIKIVEGDIKEADKLFPLSYFDVISCNPPYINQGKGLISEASPKAIARHEILCNLEDVVKNASKLLKPGGKFFMIHKPHRLVEIIEVLKSYSLEPKRIRFVHPYVHKEPNMVMIEASRHGKAMVKIEKPLIIYKDIKKYSDEIYDIYGYEKSEKSEHLGIREE